MCLWFKKIIFPFPLQECLHQGCDLVRRGKRKNWVSKLPPLLGYWNACRADTGWRWTFGLICENLCNFFFSVLHYIQITELQINLTFVILGVMSSFFGAFPFFPGSGRERGKVLSCSSFVFWSQNVNTIFYVTFLW